MMALDIPNIIKKQGVRIVGTSGEEAEVDSSGNIRISHIGDLDVNVKNASIPITHTGDLDVNITNASITAAVSGDINIDGVDVINTGLATMNKGENLIKTFIVDTMTVNHEEQNGHIIDMMTDDTTFFLEFRTNDAAATTSTLIFDFGSIDTFHSTILALNLFSDEPNSKDATCTCTLQYSSNKTDWTNIDTETDESSTGVFDNDYDFVGNSLTYRYLKIICTTQQDTAPQWYKRIRLKSLITTI